MADSEKVRGIHSLLKLPAVYANVQRLMGTQAGRHWVYDEYIRAQENDLVLDIGCGPGSKRHFLKTKNYIGIDFNEQHIATARAKYPSDTFIVGDVTRYDFSEFGKFDKVLMLGVVHHISDEDVIPVLQAARNLLKPGGIFFATDPVFEPNQNPIARLLAKLDQGNHVRDMDHYDRLLKEAFGHGEHLIKRDLHRFPYSLHLMKAVAA